MHIYPRQMDPPSINHRSLQHHYTSSLWHIKVCTYTNGRWTPLNQPQISATPLHFITLTHQSMHIYQWQTDSPWIDHMSLQHPYTSWQKYGNTQHPMYKKGMHIYPRQMDPLNQPQISVTPLHFITLTYQSMHIFQWQMAPQINHRSLQHHYTSWQKYGHT